jgi:hypothetical protein
MTNEARREAEKYIKHSLASQKRLGYSAKIAPEVYEATVAEAARAVDKLLRAQQRTSAPA